MLPSFDDMTTPWTRIYKNSAHTMNYKGDDFYFIKDSGKYKKVTHRAFQTNHFIMGEM